VSDDLSHLTPAAAELLQAPNDQRIRAILGERWVQYARATQVLRILDLLLEHPRTTRMPSIAVYGDSGMGKTMIMQRFREQHPPLFDSRAGIERTRVPCNSLASRASGASMHRF
jgi:predicted ATPase